MKIKVQAHVVYQTQFHVVFIPKRRKKILISGVKEYLGKVLYTSLTERYEDVYISEQNIQVDHVHLLMEIPPKYSVSSVVGYMKSTSARLLRKKFEYLNKGSSLWSVGYFVSSVGVNESIIRKYILYQEKQDLGQATF